MPEEQLNSNQPKLNPITLERVSENLGFISAIIASGIMVCWMLFSVGYVVVSLWCTCVSLSDLTSDWKKIGFLLFPFFYHAIIGLILKIQELHFLGFKAKAKDFPQKTKAEEEEI
jgi:hypothetical protein